MSGSHRYRSSFLVSNLIQRLGRMIYLAKVIQLVWQASGGWLIVWTVLLVLQGLLPVAVVYLTRSAIDALVVTAGQGLTEAKIQLLAVPTCALLALLLVEELLKGISEWIRVAQSELVQDHISRLIQSQSISIDYGCYESSLYNDQLERARDGGMQQSLALLEGMGSLVQNSITLFAMAAVLLSYGIALPLVLLTSTLPALWVTLRLNRAEYQWFQQTTTDRRRVQYFDLAMTHNMTAAEIRAFELGPYFQSLYGQLRRQLRQGRMALIRKQSLERLGAGLVGFLLIGGIAAWFGVQVLLGTLSMGDLALFFQAFNKGQGIIKILLSNVGSLYRNSLFISNLFEFLQIKPTIVDPVNPVLAPAVLTRGICFRGITFRYPGIETPVLQNFDLNLPAGKVIAIVGDNGAGKSTLLKLLCRLYDPESGSVEIDGVDIRRLEIAELRRLITVLFQNPMEYCLTVGQNIQFGDLSRSTTLSDWEQAARWAGIHDKVVSLPKGYDSTLGKLFPGGTDLSGGEWQRLSLARAYLRQANIIILDEPTSAMDPWAEAAWIERFRMMSSDRTAIVITHRFSLAMCADLIYVMKAGQIVESGSHHELLRQRGFYAQSWQAQTRTEEALSS
jgi:ATP-binding cassette subfamily B protein